MTLDINSRLVITEQDWQQHVNQQVADYQASYLEEGVDLDSIPSYQPFLDFFISGNLPPLLESAAHHNYQIDWYKILATNPSRSAEQYQHNIELFWEWLLADEPARIQSPHMYDAPVLDNYFWSPVDAIYIGNGQGLCDPEINRTLFKVMFGDEFQSGISFPFELGPQQWRPHKQLDPASLFTELMRYLRLYLFSPHQGLAPAMILIALEYWFSIIPLIRDSYFSESGYFGLAMDHDAYMDYEMDEDQERVYNHQESIRRFFGLLHGYQVCRPEDNNEICDNDPQAAEYIRKRFAEMDLPDEFHQLIAFLHRHKEDSLQVTA